MAVPPRSGATRSLAPERWARCRIGWALLSGSLRPDAGPVQPQRSSRTRMVLLRSELRAGSQALSPDPLPAKAVMGPCRTSARAGDRHGAGPVNAREYPCLTAHRHAAATTGAADQEPGSVRAETVCDRPVRRVISTNGFEVVEVCPVWCIGVAAPLARRSVEMTSTVSRCRAIGIDKRIAALT
jgi:hypothetical protein